MADVERATRAAPVVPAEVDDPTGTHWWLAAVPIVVLVGATFALLVRSGVGSLGAKAEGARLFEIIGAANPYPPCSQDHSHAPSSGSAKLGTKAKRSIEPPSAMTRSPPEIKSRKRRPLSSSGSQASRSPVGANRTN
jgi:hypothetical protein